METISVSPIRQRPLQRSRAGRVSLFSAVCVAAAIGLGGASRVSAAPQPERAAVPADTRAPSREPGFIPLDPSTQPQAGNTQVQVPDAASNQEIKGQYGMSLVFLVIGGVFTTALLVWLFMALMRRTWDSNHPPASQRRHSD
jgi:hypothetical protein